MVASFLKLYHVLVEAVITFLMCFSCIVLIFVCLFSELRLSKGPQVFKKHGIYASVMDGLWDLERRVMKVTLTSTTGKAVCMVLLSGHLGCSIQVLYVDTNKGNMRPSSKTDLFVETLLNSCNSIKLPPPKKKKQKQKTKKQQQQNSYFWRVS